MNDKMTSFEELKKAAKKGDEDAMLKCGLMLFNGDGISKNKKEASQYFSKAADKGNAVASFYYAKMLFTGDGIQKNQKKKAIKYLQQSSNQSNPDALNMYGKLLLDG